MAAPAAPAAPAEGGLQVDRPASGSADDGGGVPVWLVVALVAAAALALFLGRRRLLPIKRRLST